MGEINNRDMTVQIISDFMKGLPIPSSLPVGIFIKIKYAHAEDVLVIDSAEIQKTIKRLEKKTLKKQEVEEATGRLITAYNEICSDKLPKVLKSNAERVKRIGKTLKTYTESEIIEVFKKAITFDWLIGKKSSWRANFDWLTDEPNIAKVLEGNYDNSTDSKTTRAGTRAATSFDVDESLKRAMARTYGNKE